MKTESEWSIVTMENLFCWTRMRTQMILVSSDNHIIYSSCWCSVTWLRTVPTWIDCIYQWILRVHQLSVKDILKTGSSSVRISLRIYRLPIHSRCMSESFPVPFPVILPMTHWLSPSVCPSVAVSSTNEADISETPATALLTSHTPTPATDSNSQPDSPDHLIESTPAVGFERGRTPFSFSRLILSWFNCLGNSATSWLSGKWRSGTSPIKLLPWRLFYIIYWTVYICYFILYFVSLHGTGIIKRSDFGDLDRLFLFVFKHYLFLYKNYLKFSQ